MRLFDLLYLTAALAHLPMFYAYGQMNWHKGHYQFFPLLFLVVGWLLYDRLTGTVFQRPSQTKPGRALQKIEKLSNVLPWLLLGLCAALLATSTIMQSSIMVVPSFMLLSASWIVGRYGVGGFRRALPAWLLLLFAIPMPWDSDLILVHQMQFLASGLASWMLDALGQIHFREGLTLVTAEKQFFAEEACSGVRSLFSSLVAISAYGVLHRFTFLQYLFNWVQVVLWVVVGNAIRVAIVVYVSDNWTEALASGPGHEMLGLVIFILIFGLALSTNKAISAFKSTWDGGFMADFDPEDESEIEANVFKPPRFSKTASWVAMVFFGLVFVLGARIIYAKQAYQPAALQLSDINKSSESDLPAEIDGWITTNFDHSIRPKNSLLAPDSYMWTLQKGNNQLLVSLDGPYNAYHDLSLCYGGVGWDVTPQYDLEPESTYSAAGKLTALDVTKRTDTGLVLFSAYDAVGTPIGRAATVSRMNKTRRNLLMAFGAYDPSADLQQIAKLPITQIQIFCQNEGEFFDEQKKELEQVFCKVRKALLESGRFRTVAAE